MSFVPKQTYRIISNLLNYCFHIHLVEIDCCVGVMAITGLLTPDLVVILMTPLSGGSTCV